MITSASLGKELVVTVPNKIGVLAGISKILADHGVNIKGVAGYGIGPEAKIMVLSDDTLRAKEAIEKGGYKNIKENEIILVDLEDAPGALKSLTSKLLSDKIDIKYIYGTACEGGCPARIIISTSDNEKALVSFKAR